MLDEILIGLFGDWLLIGGNVHDLVGGAELVIVGIDDGLLVKDIDLSLEMILLAKRNQDWPHIRAKLLPHAAHSRVEVRAHAVHLVDESDAGHAVFACLTPDGFRLGLHPRDAAKYGDGAVQHAERAFHLGREIDVSGRIDDVYPLFDAFKGLVNALLLPLHP